MPAAMSFGQKSTLEKALDRTLSTATKNSEQMLAVFFAGCPGVMMFMLYHRMYPIVSPALSRRHLYRDVAHSQPSAQDLERTSSIRAWRMAEIMTSIANSISSREGTEGATRMLLSISSSL